MKTLVLFVVSLMSFSSIAKFDCFDYSKLKSFHNETKAFMNADLKKFSINDCTVLRHSQFSPSQISSKEYVTLKDKLRKNHCNDSTCLSNSNKKSSRRIKIDSEIAYNDDPKSLTTNGTVISNVKEIETKSLMSSRTELDIWSDWYWPIASGQLGYRYQSKHFTDYLYFEIIPEDEYWKELFKYWETNPATAIINVNELSPSEKYDLLVGDSENTLTTTMFEAGRGYYEEYGKVEQWMGICHGWAPAAYKLPRPKNSIDVMAADGKTKINFTPTDIKALGSLLWASTRFNSKFVGGRCNDKDPAADENGRIQSSECFDNNPGAWHQAVVTEVGLNNKTFVMDATYDYEVWNHPVTAYKYEYFNPTTTVTKDTLEDALVKLDDFANDKFKKYRSPKAVYVVGINMETQYLVETRPSARKKDEPYYDDFRRVYYTYDLELDAELNIVGGEWYTNKHPDFLWTPAVDVTYTDADQYLTDVSLDKLNDPIIKVVAPITSKSGSPLGKIVELLFKKSSAVSE